MRVFRRFLGRTGDDVPAPAPVDPTDVDADERQHELDVLREAQDRMDELTLRQQRYARYAWQPPAQGGERRADDGDVSSEDG
jgi:hypothetical protein